MGRGTRGLWWMVGLAVVAVAGCRGGFDVPGGLTPVDVGTSLDGLSTGDGGSADGVGPGDGASTDIQGDVTVDTWLPPETCGDGLVDPGEQCDDTAPGDEDVQGDGCFQCAVEPGWTCVGAPSQCETRCGDGVPRRGVRRLR